MSEITTLGDIVRRHGTVTAGKTALVRGDAREAWR
jgi:tRNA A37 threonylcarbamoyladenosine biosynthesis protein TsaE